MSPCHLVIGVIGGIGSGKSRVAAEFARHGACILRADEAGHEALRQPAIRAEVVRRFGTGVLDERGEIDRRKLGAVVFADPARRQELEALVHPWIKRRLAEQVKEALATGTERARPGLVHCPLVVLDAAVLLEAGWTDLCDRIVYVHAPRAMRLRRVRQQRGWTADELAARERAQYPLAVKAGRADCAIDNSGPPEHLARQVDGLVREWRRSED